MTKYKRPRKVVESINGYGFKKRVIKTKRTETTLETILDPFTHEPVPIQAKWTFKANPKANRSLYNHRPKNRQLRQTFNLIALKFQHEKNDFDRLPSLKEMHRRSNYLGENLKARTFSVLRREYKQRLKT